MSIYGNWWKPPFISIKQQLETLLKNAVEIIHRINFNFIIYLPAFTTA